MIHPTSNLVEDVLCVNLDLASCLLKTLPSITPWEEIANNPRELPPRGPYTAARFARWDEV